MNKLKRFFWMLWHTERSPFTGTLWGRIPPAPPHIIINGHPTSGGTRATGLDTEAQKPGEHPSVSEASQLTGAGGSKDD